MGVASRLLALLRKELLQIAHNRQLIVLLLVPPTLQLFLFGFVLNPQVEYVSMVVADEAHTAASRELIARFAASSAFTVDPRARTAAETADLVRRGAAQVGVVIPVDFERARLRDGAQVQIVVDAVNAYVAGIAGGYASEITATYAAELAGATVPLAPEVVYAYNPGLVSSWFFVLGALGAVLTFVALLASAVEAIGEKERGTLEQLLMAPVPAWTIVVAKLAPTFVLCMGSWALAATVAELAFRVPMRGSLAALAGASALYVLSAVSLGLLLATLERTRRQVILTGMFLALPTVMLSGALAPIDSMPPFFRTIALANPLLHYSTIVRDVWLKGAGIETYWPNVLVLVVFTIACVWISAARYRAQLA